MHLRAACRIPFIHCKRVARYVFKGCVRFGRSRAVSFVLSSSLIVHGRKIERRLRRVKRPKRTQPKSPPTPSSLSLSRSFSLIQHGTHDVCPHPPLFDHYSCLEKRPTDIGMHPLPRCIAGLETLRSNDRTSRSFSTGRRREKKGEGKKEKREARLHPSRM